jgi:hypothetical protein
MRGRALTALVGSSILAACAAPFTAQDGVLVVPTPGLIAAAERRVTQELAKSDMAQYGELIAYQTGDMRYSICGKVTVKESSGQVTRPLPFYAEASAQGAASGNASYVSRKAIVGRSWANDNAFYIAFPICRPR